MLGKVVPVGGDMERHPGPSDVAPSDIWDIWDVQEIEMEMGQRSYGRLCPPGAAAESQMRYSKLWNLIQGLQAKEKPLIFPLNVSMASAT